MRREGYCSAFLRGLLKLFNFFIGFIGLALILYVLWFLHTLSESSSHISRPPDRTISSLDLPTSWFPYFLLGVGTLFCITAFIGHFAADTAAGCCLSTYTFFLVLLILFQGAFVTDILVNKNWEEGIPDDSTGLFEIIKDFIEGNIDVCKWVGLVVVVIEAIPAVLSLCVKAVAPSSCCGSYDSDDEYLGTSDYMPTVRQPLLNHAQGSGRPVMVTVAGFPYRASSSSTSTKPAYAT